MKKVEIQLQCDEQFLKEVVVDLRSMETVISTDVPGRKIIIEVDDNQNISEYAFIDNVTSVQYV